jgi:predicted  nucleic acid-binding Zn-ribbon protein
VSSIDDLNAEHDKLVARRERLRSELLDLGARQRAIADQIAALEQQYGDEQALSALRSRGGIDGAMAARGIAATMPDPERAQRFEALAQELLG